MIFRFAGLKYQETTVKTINSVGPKNSIAPSPLAACDTMAPDIEKKKPA